MKMFILALTLLMSQASFATVSGDTIVETNHGQVAIQTLVKGDEIVSVAEGSAPYNIKPKTQKLVFTDGLSLQDLRVVYITFGNDNRTLVVSLDQPVLTENGIIKRAADLAANDKLIDAKGANVEIKSVSLGLTNNFMVGLAPASNFVTENLFLANGVYLGSYKVEMHMHDHIIIYAFLGMEF